MMNENIFGLLHSCFTHFLLSNIDKSGQGALNGLGLGFGNGSGRAKGFGGIGRPP